MQARSHSAGSGSVTGVTQSVARAPLPDESTPSFRGAPGANPESRLRRRRQRLSELRNRRGPSGVKTHHRFLTPREPTKSTPSEMSFRLGVIDCARRTGRGIAGRACAANAERDPSDRRRNSTLHGVVFHKMPPPFPVPCAPRKCTQKRPCAGGAPRPRPRTMPSPV
jgi:hypothetical protein